MKKVKIVEGLWVIYGEFVCMCIFTIGMLVFGRVYHDITGYILAAAFVIIISIMMVNSYSRVLTTVYFDSEGIDIKLGFKKSQRLSYKVYSHVYYGYYCFDHRTHKYIVISQRILSKDELSHINAPRRDETVFKIPFTKKNYMNLIEVLPPRLAIQLQNEFRGMKGISE